MNKVYIEKDIFVRDKHKVRRQAFIAGEYVDRHAYDSVISTNSVENPQDLPNLTKAKVKVMETKVLTAPVIEEVPVEVVEEVPPTEEQAPAEEDETTSEEVVPEKKTKRRKKKDSDGPSDSFVEDQSVEEY